MYKKVLKEICIDFVGAEDFINLKRYVLEKNFLFKA